MRASGNLAVIEVAGGRRIAAPDAIELMTPYVLREQERWFEDEWDCVRDLVQPGRGRPRFHAVAVRDHVWVVEASADEPIPLASDTDFGWWHRGMLDPEDIRGFVLFRNAPRTYR